MELHRLRAVSYTHLFRLKRGLFVDHDEMYSGFFLFRAQKRGMLREK